MPTQSLPGALTDFSFRRFVVRVTEGADLGRQAVSDGQELSIGTAAGNELQLTDPTVSRHHCVITARPDGIHLRDVGSTNGTFFAGHRVDSAWLKAGSTLRLGATHLRFDQLPEEVREPLAEGDRCGRMLGSSVPMRRIF